MMKNTKSHLREKKRLFERYTKITKSLYVDDLRINIIGLLKLIKRSAVVAQGRLGEALFGHMIQQNWLEQITQDLMFMVIGILNPAMIHLYI